MARETACEVEHIGITVFARLLQVMRGRHYRHAAGILPPEAGPGSEAVRIPVVGSVLPRSRRLRSDVTVATPRRKENLRRPAQQFLRLLVICIANYFAQQIYSVESGHLTGLTGEYRVSPRPA